MRVPTSFVDLGTLKLSKILVYLNRNVLIPRDVT